MVKMPRFETYCLETGVKTLVTETGQQLPPSIVSTLRFELSNHLPNDDARKHMTKVIKLIVEVALSMLIQL